MARWLPGLQGLKSGGVFVILAIVAFGAVVFLLFRTRASGPQGAAASDARTTVNRDMGPPGILGWGARSRRGRRDRRRRIREE
jgi:hypothetical protein